MHQPVLDTTTLKTAEDIENFDFRPYMNKRWHFNWIQYIKYPVSNDELDRICQLSQKVVGMEMYHNKGELVFKGTY